MYGISRRGDTFIAVGARTAETGDLDGAVWTSADGESWAFNIGHVQGPRALGGSPDDQTIRA